MLGKTFEVIDTIYRCIELDVVKQRSTDSRIVRKCLADKSKRSSSLEAEIEATFVDFGWYSSTGVFTIYIQSTRNVSQMRVL